MADRPILFNGAMVHAILAGRKTQTRRAIKPQPANDSARHHPIAPYHNGSGGWNWVLAATGHGTGDPFPCPFGAPGDRLWVREAHAIFSAHGQHRGDGKRWGPWGGLPTTASQDGEQIAYYREGFDRSDPGRWRPSIHMPRWASRILLEIIAVRVERLQAINEADAMAEGAEPILVPPDGGSCPYTEGFRDLWTSTGGDWAANPWVWVVGFRIAEGPVDG